MRVSSIQILYMLCMAENVQKENNIIGGSMEKLFPQRTVIICILQCLSSYAPIPGRPSVPLALILRSALGRCYCCFFCPHSSLVAVVRIIIYPNSTSMHTDTKIAAHNFLVFTVLSVHSLRTFFSLCLSLCLFHLLARSTSAAAGLEGAFIKSLGVGACKSTK